MRNAIALYCDEEDFSRESVSALEGALKNEVQSDCTLALEIVFVGEEEIQRLNRETRGVDKVTDVLSYPALDGIKGKKIAKKAYLSDIDEEGNLLIGAIAICLDRAREQAEEYGHSFERELNYLIVHGVFHCLGYDHMTDEEKAEMREKEEKILEKLGIRR